MVFGVFVSPGAFLVGIVAVILALIIPFFVIEAILSPLPDPFRTIGVVALSYIGMPVLLCYLHHRKLFGTGFGSGFFTLYSWFYLGFGALIMGGAYNAEGGPTIEGMAGGAVMAIVGVGMIWWGRRSNRNFIDAVEQGAEIQADIDREEAIQIQAEAILRAEQMRGSQDQS